MTDYEFDWSAAGLWMQALAGFANAGVIAWAAVKGSQKFNDWLKQRQTERKIDVGEKVLSVVYRAKEVFNSIRSPMSLAGEVAEVEAELKANYPGYEHMDAGKRGRLKTAQTAYSRIAHHTDFWREASDLMPSARTFFGREMEENLRSIFQQRQAIWASASVFPDINQQASPDLYKRCEADFWSVIGRANGTGDRISEALDDIVTCAEQAILPLLISEAAKSTE